MDIQAYVKNFEDVLKNPSPVFSEWKKIRDRMIVHTRGVVPSLLLNERRPSEPEDIFSYRKKVYRAITKDGINHAIDSVQRTLISSNYVITPAPSTEKFIKNKRFTIFENEDVYEPLEFRQLVIEHISRIKYDDPNGFLVWMPVHPTDKSLTPLETQPTQKIDIEPCIVDSYRVRDISQEHLTFEALKKWKWEYLDYQKKTHTREDAYYFVITKEAIWRLLPYWDEADKKIKYRKNLYYDIALLGNGESDTARVFKFLPAKILGGNLTMNEKNEKYFESFFQSYAEFGDEAICAFSDNQAVRVRFNFPFVAVKSNKCPECKGAGNIQDKDGNKTKCKKCSGSGSEPFSPFGVYLRKEPTSTENEQWALSDFVQFGSPDPAILQASFDAWQKMLEYAKESINLVFTKEAQSGVAKEIDREEKQDMLFKISNNDFDLIKFSLDCIEAYLEINITDRKTNTVTPPTTFQIKSQFTLVEELKQMMDSDAPQPFIVTTSQQIAEKIYGGDIRQRKIVDVLSVWDVLFAMDEGDITSLRASNDVQQKDVIRHIHGYKILLTMSEENDFVTKKVSEIIIQAETELLKLMPDEEEPLVDENGEQET